MAENFSVSPEDEGVEYLGNGRFDFKKNKGTEDKVYTITYSSDSCSASMTYTVKHGEECQDPTPPPVTTYTWRINSNAASPEKSEMFPGEDNGTFRYNVRINVPKDGYGVAFTVWRRENGQTEWKNMATDPEWAGSLANNHFTWSTDKKVGGELTIKKASEGNILLAEITPPSDYCTIYPKDVKYVITLKDFENLKLEINSYYNGVGC